jgi:hypothetical protein
LYPFKTTKGLSTIVTVTGDNGPNALSPGEASIFSVGLLDDSNPSGVGAEITFKSQNPPNAKSEGIIAEDFGSDVNTFKTHIVKGHSYTTKIEIIPGGGNRYTVKDNTAGTPPEVFPPIGQPPLIGNQKWTKAAPNIRDEWHSNSNPPTKRFTFSHTPPTLLDKGDAGTPSQRCGNVDTGTPGPCL